MKDYHQIAVVLYNGKDYIVQTYFAPDETINNVSVLVRLKEAAAAIGVDIEDRSKREL